MNPPRLPPSAFSARSFLTVKVTAVKVAGARASPVDTMEKREKRAGEPHKRGADPIKQAEQMLAEGVGMSEWSCVSEPPTWEVYATTVYPLAAGRGSWCVHGIKRTAMCHLRA